MNEVVLDFLEGAQHRLPVVGDVFPIGGGRLIDARLARAAVEHRQRQHGADQRPEQEAAAAPFEQVAELGRLVAESAGQLETRKERRARGADARVGGGHRAFGGGDVGAPFEQLRRQAGRNADRHLG